MARWRRADRQVRMKMQQHARALDGDVVGRNSVLCPGPGHSTRDRSLSVTFLEGGAFVVHSHAGDSWQDCRDHVRTRLGLPEVKRILPPPVPSHDLDATSRALELWRETKLLKGSPGELHLNWRGVSYDGDALRWHPSCPFGKGVRHGCMVGLVRNIITNEPQAIHRTAIDAEGNKIDRKALGPVGGGAVKLTDNADVAAVLGIGEGIETTLSIRRLPGLELMPLWAVLTANGIESFPALPGIESVWIAADNDTSGTGQRVAKSLAHRLDDAGIEPIIIMPRAVGSDLNDKAVAHV